MSGTKEEGPVIELDVGKIQGLTVELNSSYKIEIFYGVPFAEPPVEENRFELPVPLKQWEGIKKTTKLAPFAYPISEQSNFPLHSEDCLYLNVFRPNKINDSLPILFMVHGGSYAVGSSARYANVEEIGQKFVAKDIVVVAIQYRLGVLGYWDQVEALKFVHRNAKAFGGSPDKITLYGSSAGAASVGALSISPHSRDYVYQVIAASGSLFGAWTTSEDVVENTRQLVYAVGADSCETVKECLKKAPIKDIYRALKQIGTRSYGVNFVKFGPRLESRFFPDDYPALINETKPKPILLGCAEEESLLFTLVREQSSEIEGFTVDLDRRKSFSEQDVRELVQLIFPEDLYTNSHEIQSRVLDFYLNDDSWSVKNNIFYMQKYTQIFSDLQFNVPIVWDILLRSKRRWPIYVYKSAYVNPGAMPETCPIKTAFHGSDQRYLVLGKDQKHFFEMNESDKNMETLMVDAFVSFIKTGSPANQNFEWMPTLPSDPTRYAELKPRPEMKNHMFSDQVKFWTQLAADFKYDPVRMRPLPDGENNPIWQAVKGAEK